jgi:hypothetical protein|tara:strand:- start:359 stop:1615 length:1257 start_codon:yes stop_codon:yes gene_type:complete
MNNFKQYYLHTEFFQEIHGAVKHIDHLEEDIINDGAAGVKVAIKNIDAIVDYFTAETDYSISLKFDGAPALVAGVDPNGGFFVASKSAFNKNPKLNYTHEDIDINHGSSGGLADKLHIALDHLPSLGMKGIYQMDYMFDDHIKNIQSPTQIDDMPNKNSFISFQPNTITYGVTKDSPYGDAINAAKLGVAIHIEYAVNNGILAVKKYTSDPSEFKKSNSVFVFNVLVNGAKNKNKRVAKLLLRDIAAKKTRIANVSAKIDFKQLEPFKVLLKTYINTEIRDGAFLENTSMSCERFITYVASRYRAQIDKLKTERGKDRKSQELKDTVKVLKGAKPSIKRLFDVTKLIAETKNGIINVFNEITRNDPLGTYEEVEGGWNTVSPEGYALSHMTDDEPKITKLVDREQFSRNNFNTDKFSK